MIDDEDVEFVALAWPNLGCFGTLLGTIVVCVLAYVACQNDKDCASKHCDRGHPVLTHHECVCEEPAK